MDLLTRFFCFISIISLTSSCKIDVAKENENQFLTIYTNDKKLIDTSKINRFEKENDVKVYFKKINIDEVYTEIQKNGRYNFNGDLLYFYGINPLADLQKKNLLHQIHSENIDFQKGIYTVDFLERVLLLDTTINFRNYDSLAKEISTNPNITIAQTKRIKEIENYNLFLNTKAFNNKKPIKDIQISSLIKKQIIDTNEVEIPEVFPQVIFTDAQEFQLLQLNNPNQYNSYRVHYLNKVENKHSKNFISTQVAIYRYAKNGLLAEKLVKELLEKK